MTSKMTSAGIVITQGDTLNIPLHFSYSQEGKKIPVDIKNAVIRMHVRENENAQPLIKKESSNHVDAANGKTILQLSPEDTDIPVGTYYTDIEIQFIEEQQFTFYPPNPNCKAFFKVVAQYTKGN